MKTYLKDRKEYQSWGKGYYHLSSDGWQNGKLFHNKAQFAYGMLLMGLLALRFKVVIYEFSLMDNHIHILFSGTGAECVRAFDYFRMKLSARLVRDGYPPLPEDYGFKLKPVKDKEQMRINFLYVGRNPLEKDIALPGGYPWGTAYLHYSQIGLYLHGVKASSLSKHKLELLAGTRTPIPPHWEFHPELGLLPSSFIDNSLFERLFAGPKDYQTRLVKEYEAFVRLGRDMEETVEFSFLEVQDVTEKLIRDAFPGKTVRSLTQDEKGRLCVLLADKFDLTSQQIATVLRMEEFLVKQILSSKDYGKKKW